MKPFDLEAAKRGEPICNRRGDPLTFIAYVPDAKEGTNLITLANDGEIFLNYKDGLYIGDGDSAFDIFMAPKKRTVWVNLYNGQDGQIRGFAYESQAVADECAADTRIGGIAHMMEIEE